MQCYYGDTAKSQNEDFMTEDTSAIEVQAEVNPESIAPESVPDDMQAPIYNKIQVQDVVKREKQKAYEKGRREAMAELESQQAQMQPQAQVPQSAPSLGGMTQMTNEQIDKMIAERMPQALQSHVQEIQTRQLVDSFVTKMQAAEQKHPGLNEKLSELDYKTMAPLVELANNMPNTGDVMKELIDNPMKMGSLMTLLYTQPKLAHREMMNLSNSIAQNEAAKAEEAQARNPMSQIKSSMNAGMDNGKPSIADFKKMFRG